MFEYLPKLLYKRNSLPVNVTFFVTTRCNLKCEHCFYSDSLNQPKDELTLEEIKQFSRTMGKFPIMLYSGGEPFLRPDLAAITKTFYNNNKIRYLAIPTNGTFTGTTKHQIEQICHQCPKLKVVLAFSIDGLEEEHNKIRGSGKAFQNALKTFHEMKPLKELYQNLRLGFIITLTATNQHKINELYDYLKTQKPDSIAVNMIRGTPKDPLVKDIDLNFYKQITKRIIDDMKKSNLPGYDNYLSALAQYRYKKIAKTATENKYQMPCYASTLAAVIYPNGDVYPCEILDCPKFKIGNLREHNLNFKHLWKSKRNKEIYQWIQSKKCFCTHECNMAVNTSFNLKHFTKIGIKSLLK